MTEDSATLAPDWAQCPDCGLLQILPSPIEGSSRTCARCRHSFGHGIIRREVGLALSVTIVVLFLLANFFPFMSISFSGRSQSVLLSSGVEGLAGYGLTPLAIFVLAISVLAPLVRVLALAAVLARLTRPLRPAYLVVLLHAADKMRPWAMLDVFLVGALISLTKLHDLATVEIGIGFWTLGVLVIVQASFDMLIDRRALWDEISPQPLRLTEPAACRWIACRECGLVQDRECGPEQDHAARCIRCHSGLHRRRPDSLIYSAALILTGLILYLPANLYPVLTFISFGRGTPATIMGGVLELMSGSDWPLALIVFTASVAVPLLKLLGLAILLISTWRGSTHRLIERTRLYRLIELVSRWSTVDIFVAALLSALVTLGNLATVEPGFGALAFGGVVFITMLAKEAFDPRLIWDAAGTNND